MNPSYISHLTEKPLKQHAYTTHKLNPGIYRPQNLEDHRLYRPERSEGDTSSPRNSTGSSSQDFIVYLF